MLKCVLLIFQKKYYSFHVRLSIKKDTCSASGRNSAMNGWPSLVLRRACSEKVFEQKSEQKYRKIDEAKEHGKYSSKNTKIRVDKSTIVNYSITAVKNKRNCVVWQKLVNRAVYIEWRIKASAA